LQELNNTHKPLLHKHLEAGELERGPELIEAEELLGIASIALGYVPYEGPAAAGSEFPTVYAVHTLYLGAYEKGDYDSSTNTWASETPEWALLQIYP
jgi:hypothetical protein